MPGRGTARFRRRISQIQREGAVRSRVFYGVCRILSNSVDADFGVGFAEAKQEVLKMEHIAFLKQALSFAETLWYNIRKAATMI